jgi:N-acetylglucosamine malate deacetylase 2
METVVRPEDEGLGGDPSLYSAPRGTWIVVAHPDDETIGSSTMIMDGVIGRVVHVTDGAPRDRALWGQTIVTSRGEYALVRRVELEAALRIAEFPRGRVETLDAIDQEAIEQLTGIIGALVERLATHRPEALVTHAFEGVHPDHDATAVAVHAAAALVAVRGVGVRVLEMAARPSPGRGRSPVFFPGGAGAPREWLRVLTPHERRVKASMLACFGSQRLADDAPYLGAERFRDAPAHDFSRPPHTGAIEYAERGWCTWARFQEHALAALRQFGVPTSPLADARKSPSGDGSGGMN